MENHSPWEHIPRCSLAHVSQSLSFSTQGSDTVADPALTALNHLLRLMNFRFQIWFSAVFVFPKEIRVSYKIRVLYQKDPLWFSLVLIMEINACYLTLLQ